MTKITVAFVDDLLKQVTKGDISFSRMVERLNEITAVEPGERNEDLIDYDIYVKPPKGKTTHKGTLHPVASTVSKETPTAFEWHNYETGHAYVDYIPHVNQNEKDGYTKIPLYKLNNK